jgi:hypothetical protein
MSLSSEHFFTEHFLAAEVPSVEQLDRLADIWRQSAQDRQALKDCQVGITEKYSRDVIETPVEVNGEQIVLQHVIGVKTGRHFRVDDAYKTVQVLDYFDTFRLPSSNVARAAIHYAFMWTDERVIRARRSISAAQPLSDAALEASLIGDLDNARANGGIDISSDEQAMIQADIEFSEMTTADCELLIAEASACFELLDIASKG